MSEETEVQAAYWNAEAEAFSRIYSHEKSGFANLLDRLFRRDMYDRFMFTLREAEPIDGRTFLDIGCGNGLYSIALARKGARRVTGIDIAENMIDRCKETARSEGVSDRCVFFHTDLLADASTATHDVSIGIGLFDYIGDPLPVLRKMRTVTTDRAILSFPRFWTWRAPVRKLRLALRGCPVFFYTRDRVEQLVRDAGFDSCTISKVGKLYCVVARCRAGQETDADEHPDRRQPHG